MFDVDDVIAAPASAAGPGARGILRISGEGSREAVAAVFEPENAIRWTAPNAPSRYAGWIGLREPNVRVAAAAYVWPTRRSYTGQPLVELHLAGSPPLVEATLADLYRSGVRPARAGEFTLRAFLAGRLDLVQAEAVLGVIDAADHKELEVALRQLGGGISGRLADVRMDLLSLLADLEAGLDFVEEEIEFIGREEIACRLAGAQQAIEALLGDASDRWRDSARRRVVLAGLPNAGKSTLFNALAGAERALVSATAGTTRDWLTAELDLEGAAVELIDTAGWEDAADDLSKAMQILRAEQLERADLILWCVAADASPELLLADERVREALGALRAKAVPLATKCDHATARAPVVRESAQSISAVTGEGMKELVRLVAAELGVDRHGSRQMLGSTAARGRDSLEAARDSLARARGAVQSGFGDEIVAVEIRLALAGLAAVLGAVYTDDVLDVLFSRFCIGK